eukprot:SAG31_NODE_4927_length_2859_cov_1.076087_2_plen_146_part_00
MILFQVYVGGYFVPIGLALFINNYFLCLILSRRPSRTDPYNTANVFNHVIVMCTLASSVILRFPTKVRPSYLKKTAGVCVESKALLSQGTAEQWLTPELIGILLAFLQVRTVAFFSLLMHPCACLRNSASAITLAPHIRSHSGCI